ncbi:unnamed protein product [Leptosia nina]|uniref:Uncharacterized protein n=1 Tax=Leptosia nina TaxID=320188 RepID=A0AAV1JDV8_9NEOP
MLVRAITVNHNFATSQRDGTACSLHFEHIRFGFSQNFDATVNQWSGGVTNNIHLAYIDKDSSKMLIV